MASHQPPVSPRRAAASAWMSGLATLAWAGFSLSRFESGWAAALIGVLALVAIGLVLARRRSTRDLGLGLFLGVGFGLVLAALVALLV